MKGSNIFFSVVIPFRNAASYLPHCLEGLASQTYSDVEFIFVDNDSTDRSSEIIRAFVKEHVNVPIKLFLEKKKGASVARNRGVAEAKGDWLVFTDADCVAGPQWLSDYFHAIRNEPHMGGFAGCILPYINRKKISRFLGLFSLPPNEKEEIFNEYLIVSGGFPSANFALPKDLFERAGRFNEDIEIYGEDHELCKNIYCLGFSIKTLTNAFIRHIHRSDLKGMIKQAFGCGRSHAYCVKKLVPPVMILGLPKFDFMRKLPFGRLWIDLGQADKKLLFCIAAAFFWKPLIVLALIYFVYISHMIFCRAKRKNIPVGFIESFLFSLLLYIRCFAMTCGRIKGSLQYKVVCL